MTPKFLAVLYCFAISSFLGDCFMSFFFIMQEEFVKATVMLITAGLCDIGLRIYEHKNKI